MTLFKFILKSIASPFTKLFATWKEFTVEADTTEEKLFSILWLFLMLLVGMVMVPIVCGLALILICVTHTHPVIMCPIWIAFLTSVITFTNVRYKEFIRHEKESQEVIKNSNPHPPKRGRNGK